MKTNNWSLSLIFLTTSYILLPTPSQAGPVAQAGWTLLEPLGARPTALGEAFAGVEASLDAITYNPAGIVGIPQSELRTIFSRGLMDDSFGGVAFAKPTKKGAWATSIGYYTTGSLELIDTGGISKTVVGEQDIALSYIWARGFSQGKGSYAFSTKALYSQMVEDQLAASIALDLGVRRQMFFEGLALGFALNNIGLPMGYSDELAFGEGEENLPTLIRLGSFYERSFKGRPLLVMADLINSIYEEQMWLALGSEYQLGKTALRLGYKFNLNDEEDVGLNLGAGFSWKSWQFDYSFGLADKLSDTHRLSIGWQF